MPINLSLGCGKEEELGWIGIDIIDYGHNFVMDITCQNLPYHDNDVGYIKCYNLLEHIERKHWRHLFNECHRVLRPDGILEIITPDAAKSIELAMQDPTHVSFVVKGTFSQYLTGNRPRNSSIGFLPWFIVELRNYDEKEPRDIFVRMSPRK